MARRMQAPQNCREELGEAQCLLLEVIVDPPADPWYEQAARGARRVIIAVVGFTIVLLGIAMIVLPGPAIVVIPLGLLVLATEFVWARRVLRRVREEAKKRTDALRGKKPSVTAPSAPVPHKHAKSRTRHAAHKTSKAKKR